ncbi:FtsX-like permease family protein [Leucobacter sp. G161]|uniref:FtsX-like permease family protein n=1 Tax=Leucobacter sp. G161 TaxID=663704 RepID=UPI0009FA8C65|nr:FtsX-like permease family protein [Leucobacter sp. G161]
MSRMSRAVGSWRPVLRLASRDALRHRTRTVLSGILIALPVAALVGFIAVSASSATSAEQALRSIPAGADAVITATAISRDAPPFEQLPEGPPGPWIDDTEVLPAGSEDVGRLLVPGTELHEYWTSPTLIASTGLGLAPGEQGAAGAAAAGLSGLGFDRLGTATLTEAEPGAFALLAPEVAAGRLPAASTEILINGALADRLSAVPGDTLTLLAPPDTGWRSTDGNTAAAMQDSERGYRIVGIADDGSDGGAGATTPHAWALSAWLSGLVDELPAGIQRHWLAIGGDVTWEQAKQLNALQAFAVSKHVLTNYPAASELYPVPLDVGAYIEAIVGIIAMSVVGGLLVLFLVTPAFAVSAEQSRRSLGLAAAAGAAPRDLRRIILAQGIVLGFVGGVLGLVLGVAGSFGVNALFERLSEGGGGIDARYSVASLLAHFPVWILPVALVIAVGLGTVAALPPALTAARLAPVDALRDRRPARPARGRAMRVVTACGGPALLVVAVALGVLAFMMPLGEVAFDPESAMQAAPPGAQALGFLITASLLLGAAGLALTVRAVIAWLGRRGQHAKPALRLALRDAADHPSRTVPAALGVLFAVAAASFSLVFGASAMASYRDSGTTLDWQGTFMLTPTVGISDDFNALLVGAAIDDIRSDTPAVTGSVPILEVARTSTLQLQPFPPTDRACPLGEAPHTASAIELGAPLRCVSQHSGAAYNASFRIGGMNSQGNVFLFSGDALRATGMPGAVDAARVLDEGGAVVGDATLISAAGTVRVGIDPEMLSEEADTDEIIEIPGAFLPGVGAPFVVSPDTAERLGVDELHYLGDIATVTQPLSTAELSAVTDRTAFQSLVSGTTPDGNDRLSPGSDLYSRVLTAAPALLLGFVAVAATGVAVLLSATQGRRDAATMLAVGADRRTLRRLGLARAAVILTLGVPAGLLAGIAAASYQVAWNRHLESSGAWLSTVVMWDAQALLGAAVIVAGLGAALLFTRPPRSLVRRALD